MASAPPAPLRPAPRSAAPGRWTPEGPHATHLPWLIRLRWAAMAAQTAVVVWATWGVGLALPVGPLLGLLGIAVVSNLVAMAWLRRGGAPGEAHAVALLGLDLGLFTALLYFTGGPSNPFSSLYLVHLALAAVVLRPRSVWMLVGAALLCSGALFLHHVPLPPPQVAHRGPGPHALHVAHAEHTLHLRGMWLAFAVAAAFIVHFLRRLVNALGEREHELERAREEAERRERLASLATLAAGAAHELATPLATIAVVTHELARELDHARAPREWREDLEALRVEIDRCRSILDSLAVDAGHPAGEPAVDTSLEALRRLTLEGLAERERVRWPETPPLELHLPARVVAQSLRNLLRNGLEASPAAEVVTVAVARRGDTVAFTITDRGAGMKPRTLARATDPFFSTRGGGRGLGLFLCRSVAEQLGGALSLRSEPGRGTEAELVLPLRAAERAPDRPRDTLTTDPTGEGTAGPASAPDRVGATLGRRAPAAPGDHNAPTP